MHHSTTPLLVSQVLRCPSCHRSTEVSRWPSNRKIYNLSFFYGYLGEGPVQKIGSKKKKKKGKNKTKSKTHSLAVKAKPVCHGETQDRVTVAGTRAFSGLPLLWDYCWDSHREQPLPAPPLLWEDSCREVAVSRAFPAPASQAPMLSVKLKEGFKRILFSFKCPCFLKH